MSWQFINDWSQRITEKETLIIREELISLLQLKPADFNLWLHKDYYGHKNLLLPNPIKEKEDNGDIDIFLFYSEKNWRKLGYFLKLLQDSENVLKINKNDYIYSLLYKSNIIWKKVQIDLHIINSSNKNKENYFEYYRIPYLYFILWMIFNKLNIKLWINWVFYRVEENININWIISKITEQFLLDKFFLNFLKWILDFDLDTIKWIDSYKKIADFLIWQWLSDYTFFKDLETIKENYKKKLNWNDKLQYIINLLPNPTKSIDDFKKVYMKRILEKYPFITLKRESIIKKYIKEKESSKERKRILQKLFNIEKLENLSIIQKQQIPLFTPILPQLSLLREMSDKVKEKFPSDNIYLVWGSVRDILLWLWNNDWDLSWSILPEDFINLFWGISTKKYWTVFVKYKWLEIEYTPFRSEEGYSGRQVDKITFSKELSVDALRRDFTINSLYLDLQNLNIIDLYGWLTDLKNKIIRAVGSPKARFEEDYLRILRALRLSSKLWYEIESKTYNAMIEVSSWLNLLSDERIIDEYFKGLNLKNWGWKRYLLILDKFNKDSKRLLDILETYKTLGSQEIYSFLIYLLGGDITKLQKLSGENKGHTFNIVLKAYQKKFPKDIQKILSEKINQIKMSDLIKILYYSKLEWFKNSQIKLFLNALINKEIIKKNTTKNTIKIVFNLYRELLEKNYKFLYKDIKVELWIDDILKYSQEKNILLSNLNEYLISEYLRKVNLEG